MERESFICYKSFVDAGMQLNDEDRLKFYDRLLKYAIFGDNSETTGFAETLFILVRPNLDSNNKKYIAGFKGGRPKKTTGFEKRAKKITSGCPEKKPNEEEEEEVEVEEEENIGGVFEEVWKVFPHARKGKKAETLKHYKKLNGDKVADEIKLLLRKIEIGKQDINFIPAIELWMRDFVETNSLVKEKAIKDIVYAIMNTESDKRKPLYERFLADFGYEMFEKYRKERSKETNGIVLKLK